MSKPVIYLSDFKLSYCNARKAKHNAFTVILGRKGKKDRKFLQNSIVAAATPLISFASFLGIQTLVFKSNTRCNGVYGLILILIIIFLIVFVSPAYWDDSIKDIPLKILSTSQGIHETLEIIIFVFITSFRNKNDYIELYKLLDKIDEHLKLSKKIFYRRQVIATVLITIPILELLLIFWVKGFSVPNLISQLILFLLSMQGTICAFFVIHIYSMLIIFNMYLLKKSQHMHPKKQISLGVRCSIMKKILVGDAHKCSMKNICWFELMQIYDKIADSMYTFNRIYNVQVLIMFNSWFVTTLLLICRILSPSVEYSNIIISELLLYFSINIRPLFLTKMSEYFVLERRKTILIILHNIIYKGNGTNNYYKDQIQIMLDLVQTRRMEISNNIFRINIPNLFGFAGRVISYAVLMIQYFYLYIHEIEAESK